MNRRRNRRPEPKPTPPAAPPTPGTRVWIVAKHPDLAAAVAAALVAIVLFSFLLNTRTFITHENTVLRIPQVAHLKHVPEIFRADFMKYTGGVYRPLAYAVLSLPRTFVRPDAAVFWHVWMLAFHVLNAVLVYRVARHFTERVACALFAMAVYLLHPLAAAFANQIDLFGMVLGVTLTLASLASYLSAVRERSVARYLAALVLLGCALLTSRAALVLPLLLVFYELVYHRRRVIVAIARSIVVIAIGAGFILLVRHVVMQSLFWGLHPAAHQDKAWYWAWGFAAGGVDALVGMLSLRATPMPVGAFTGAVADPWNLRTIFYGIAILAVAGFTLWGFARRRWAFVGVALLFFGAAGRFHMPTNLFDDYSAWSYRLLPLAGLALAAGAVLEALLRVATPALRRVVAVAAVSSVVVSAAFLAVDNVRARNPVTWWQHAARVMPESQVAKVMLGKAYLDEGDRAQALIYLFSPKVRSTRLSCMAMARYYSEHGDRVAAMVHMHSANREATYELGFVEQWRLLADIVLREGAYDFAEQWLGRVLMVYPDDVRALTCMGGVLATKGYLRAGLVHTRAALETDPTDPAARKQYETLQLRFEDPLHHDKAGAPHRPPDADWLRFTSDENTGQAMWDDVIARTRTYPDDPVILLYAGIYLVRLDRHAEAARVLDRAIASLRSNAYAWATRCWAAAHAHDEKNAMKFILEARSLDLGDALTWHELGLTVLKEGYPEVASEAFRTALDANPDVAESHNNLGMLLVRYTGRDETSDEREARYREAEGHFRAALSLPRTRRGGVHNGLAFTLMNLGRYDEAIEQFKQAIALDPDRATAYNYLAQTWEAKGDYYESVRALSLGLKQMPKNMLLRISLVRVLSGAPEPGVLDGKRAVEIAQSIINDAKHVEPEMLALLAAAHSRAGDFEKAVATSDEALTMAYRVGRGRTIEELTLWRERYVRRQPFRFSGPSEETWRRWQRSQRQRRPERLYPVN